jgi:uncharacterized protein (TIGR02147 family)
MRTVAMLALPDVFQYSDYRRFLADFYACQKQRQPSFSYESFSRKAGFRNRGFLFNVIAGRKNLSAASVGKLASHVTRTAGEADYFANLVAFNQTQDLESQNLHFERMSAIKSNKAGAAQVRELRRDQYLFYSRWYYAAVRSLLEMHRFKGDWRWLARKLQPPISAREARAAVGALVRLGLVQRTPGGAYRALDKVVRPGPEVQRLAIRNFHLQVAQLAQQAVRRVPVTRRNVTGLTLGISAATYERICQETQRFQAKLLALAEADREADEVYQYNFQFFPLSNPKVKERRP